MYRMSMRQEQLRNLIYSATPIDTIVSTKDLPNGVEVTGYVRGHSRSYKILNNGVVMDNEPDIGDF